MLAGMGEKDVDARIVDIMKKAGFANWEVERVLNIKIARARLKVSTN